jgi:hypothetical protein
MTHFAANFQEIVYKRGSILDNAKELKCGNTVLFDLILFIQ